MLPSGCLFFLHKQTRTGCWAGPLFSTTDSNVAAQGHTRARIILRVFLVGFFFNGGVGGGLLFSVSPAVCLHYTNSHRETLNTLSQTHTKNVV